MTIFSAYDNNNNNTKTKNCQGTDKIIPISAAKLLTTDFPPLSPLVESLLPSIGISMLAGAPKAGKSLLHLALCCHIVSGRSDFLGLSIDQKKHHQVLIIALEDGKRRLYNRLKRMGFSPNELTNLYVLTSEAFIGMSPKERFEYLLRQKDAYPNLSLIVIDTLIAFQPTSSGQQTYHTDYKGIQALRDIAEKLKVGILLISHTREAASEDPFDLIYGSRGIQGALDGMAILDKRGNLYLRGRDWSEDHLIIELDPESLQWTLKGRNMPMNLSEAQLKIYNALIQANEILSPTDLQNLSGISANTIKASLKTLVEKGYVEKVTHGRYKAKIILTF